MKPRSGARPPLPGGRPTFLFTDIEGSTRLIQDLGERYPELLDVHRSLLRTAFDAYRGVEVGTEGDGFFVAFGEPSDAVEAARAAQLALAAHEWPPGAEVRVRIGMHTGEAEIAEDDYIGLAVHVAARVSAIGRGGQVLLSDATRALVAGIDVLDHGEHRLKDIRTPVHVYQLLDPGLRASFGPLRSLTAIPNNLPAAVDEFVGRKTELAELTTALEEHRLVTLVGPGGSGKTRLALEIAARFVARVPGGVWLVELAATTDGEHLDTLAAAALGVDEEPGRPLRETLVHSLRARELLIVLDNCEHIVESTASFVSEVLGWAPGVRVLATSRERLGVRGEHLLAVPPLQLPEPDELAADCDAVRLFLARAGAVSATFAPDEASARTIASICRQLDGLPLAIELAAARVRSMSLDQLAERLRDRFGLLTAADRSAPSRQRTLESVVAWSYDLLSEPERVLFARLAVFPDSFTLDAVEAVCAGPLVDHADVLELITALVDKSLVSTLDTAAGTERYQLLETLRAYGHRRLLEGDELATWRASLRAWALGLVDTLERAMRTPSQDEALRNIRPEHANLRAAVEWAIDSGDHLGALRIVSAAPIGTPSQRLELIADLLDRVPDAPPAIVGQALITCTNLEFDRGAFERAVAAGRRAEEAFETTGDQLHAAWARYFQVTPAWAGGDLARVDELCARLLDEFEALESQMGIAYVSWTASTRAVDADRAAELAAAACDAFRAMGADHGLAHALEGLALAAVRGGSATLAVPHIAEALALFVRSGNPGCVAHALEAASACIAEIGDLTDVAELTGAAEAFREATGHAHKPWELQGHQEALRALGAGAPELDAARQRGRTHSLASAAEHAAAVLATLTSAPGNDRERPHAGRSV